MMKFAPLARVFRCACVNRGKTGKTRVDTPENGHTLSYFWYGYNSICIECSVESLLEIIFFRVTTVRSERLLAQLEMEPLILHPHHLVTVKF